MKWLALTIGVSLAACRSIESPPATTSIQTSPPAVTRLESPTAIEPTRVEVIIRNIAP